MTTVYTGERLAGLANIARQRLAALGYTNIDVYEEDGTLDWSDQGRRSIVIVGGR